MIAGGVEAGESPGAAAERELLEESGLIAEVRDAVKVIEYDYPLTEEPAERQHLYDPSLLQVAFETLRWPETAQALRDLVPSRPT